jgi:hypothetical protein
MKPQPAFGPFLVIGPFGEPIKEKIQNFKTAQGKPEAGFLANKIFGVVEVGQGVSRLI